MKIIRATTEHLEPVARLFDLYRQFYKQTSDIELARTFIGQRLNNNESTIFVALDDDTAAGFTQLYPSFCSVDAVRRIILYDLYVAKDYRRTGAGEALMMRARDFARETGAARIDLETEDNNYPGQALYEKLGYKRANERFFAYSLEL